MRQAHTIQDMSELEAARAILEDVRILINQMLPEILEAQVTEDASIGTLLDNIEEAAERIEDLNYDEDNRLNPHK
jgi:dihydroxyacetone kinase DhaKLM complex PTS-EIIA-like component DhaM